jgi:hypothetical protein
MVLRAGLKKMRLYVELKIYDKNRRKITGPQCVKFLLSSIYMHELHFLMMAQKWSKHEADNKYVSISTFCCSH